MSIEVIVLLITTILGVAKAFFEWRKARAEARRANTVQNMLDCTIRGVEDAREVFPTIHLDIKKRALAAGVEGDLNKVVKSVTEKSSD